MVVHETIPANWGQHESLRTIDNVAVVYQIGLVRNDVQTVLGSCFVD
jgi:hypothetical protein